jgi:hypothetical protein
MTVGSKFWFDCWLPLQLRLFRDPSVRNAVFFACILFLSYLLIVNLIEKLHCHHYITTYTIIVMIYICHVYHCQLIILFLKGPLNDSITLPQMSVYVISVFSLASTKYSCSKEAWVSDTSTVALVAWKWAPL